MPEGHSEDTQILEISLAIRQYLFSKFSLTRDCVTPITEPDTEKRFLAKKKEFEDKYSRFEPIRFVLHGTSERSYNSIIENGFLAPKEQRNGKSIHIAHGNAYGRGVYGGDTFGIALKYGTHVIVCAGVFGEIGNPSGNYSELNCDTAVVRNFRQLGNAYITKTSDQLVPLYVFKRQEFYERFEKPEETSEDTSANTFANTPQQ